MFAWQQIPRSTLLTGQFDLGGVCDSRFCAAVAKGALDPESAKRSSIETIVGRLNWYADLWGEVQGLRPENFSKALASATEAWELRAQNENRERSELENFTYTLQRLESSRLPEELGTWQSVVAYDDGWKQSRRQCLKCRSECTVMYHDEEYPDGEYFAEFVCLGSPDSPCGYVDRSR